MSGDKKNNKESYSNFHKIYLFKYSFIRYLFFIETLFFMKSLKTYPNYPIPFYQPFLGSYYFVFATINT